MRKLIWLALAALIAGTVYAETSPGFSGSFEFYNTYRFDKPQDKEDFVIGNKYEVKIAVNGVIDEWTTVNAEITKKRFEVAERVLEVKKGVGKTGAEVEIGDTIVTDMDEYEVKKDGDDGYGKTISEFKVYDTDEYDTMVLNEFTMTNDITGALGFADSPVGVSLTWGKTSLKPAAFHKVAGEEYLGNYETDSYLGIKIATTIVEKVKVITAIYPETYLNDYYEEGRKKAPVGAIDLQFLGLVEGLNFNLFFTSDRNKDRDGDTKAHEETKEIGLTAGYTGVENLSLGLATSYDLWKGKEDKDTGKEKEPAFDLGVSASYSLLEGRLVPALALVIEKFPMTTEEEIAGKKVKSQTAVELYLGFDTRFKIVPDTLDAVFNIKLPMKGKAKQDGEVVDKDFDLGKYMKDKMSFDIGLEAFLGSVTYGLGYEYEKNDRNKYSPNGDDSSGLYFKVKASF